MIMKPSSLHSHFDTRLGKLWSYPRIFINDLADLDLPERIKQDVLGCAWEFTRKVMPDIRNWARYIAFVRIVVITLLSQYPTEYDLEQDDNNLFGYKLNELLELLFWEFSSESREDLNTELRTFLLSSTMSRHGGPAMNSGVTRWNTHIPLKVPREWFRARDFDSLFRFLAAGVLACNDCGQEYESFSDVQLEILSEMCSVMHDTVKISRHRLGDDGPHVFDCIPEHARIETFRQYREVSLAMDAAYAWSSPAHSHIRRLMDVVGAPFHLVLRRTRFVSYDLVIRSKGRQSTNSYKPAPQLPDYGYHSPKVVEASPVIRDNSRDSGVFFPDSPRMIFPDPSDKERCANCTYLNTSVTFRSGHDVDRTFQPCDSCADEWQDWIESFSERAAEAFPQLKVMLGFVQDMSEEEEDDMKCLPSPTWDIDKKLIHDPWSCICAWQGGKVLT